MENVNPESTISMEEQTTTEPAVTEPAEPTAPQEAEQSEVIAEQPTENEDVVEVNDTPFISVKFRHENRDMTREEAIAFAQKGLLYDHINPIFNKLDYLAAQKDISVGELVTSLLEADENAHRQELIERYGEESKAVEELMELYRNKSGEKYQKVLADRQKAEAKAEQKANLDRQTSLAEQFAKLQEEVPEIATVKDIPQTVLSLADKNKIDLVSAYLLHKHREEKRIAAAEALAAQQSKTSTGSARSNETTGDTAVDAFIRGARQKL